MKYFMIIFTVILFHQNSIQAHTGSGCSLRSYAKSPLHLSIGGEYGYTDNRGKNNSFYGGEASLFYYKKLGMDIGGRGWFFGLFAATQKSESIQRYSYGFEAGLTGIPSFLGLRISDIELGSGIDIGYLTIEDSKKLNGIAYRFYLFFFPIPVFPYVRYGQVFHGNNYREYGVIFKVPLS